MTWRSIDHTADAAVEVEAPTFMGLLAEAVRAFSDTVTDVAAIEEREGRSIRAAAPERDLLLREVLEEVLYLHDTEGFIASSVRPGTSATTAPSEGAGGLEVELLLLGERFDPDRHPHRVLVKAVTYHRLAVAGDDSTGWRARVVFDL